MCIRDRPVTNYFFMGGMAAYMDLMDADRASAFGERFRAGGTSVNA